MDTECVESVVPGVALVPRFKLTQGGGLSFT